MDKLEECLIRFSENLHYSLVINCALGSALNMRILLIDIPFYQIEIPILSEEYGIMPGLCKIVTKLCNTIYQMSGSFEVQKLS